MEFLFPQMKSTYVHFNLKTTCRSESQGFFNTWIKNDSKSAMIPIMQGNFIDMAISFHKSLLENQWRDKITVNFVQFNGFKVFE